MKKYFQINKESWNAVEPVHRDFNFQSSVANLKKQNFTFLHKRELKFLKKTNLGGRSVIQLCCNNGREILSLKKLGPKRAVGIDFSEKFIEEAIELSKETGIEAEFYSYNAVQIPAKFSNSFDLVYLSVGTIEWFEDINKFFLSVSKLLKKGGYLLIHEMHPLVHNVKLVNTGFSKRLELFGSYFDNKPEISLSAIKYYPGKYPKLKPQHFFPHTISDIINSISKNKMELKEYYEYPEDITLSYINLEKLKPKFPMSYLLIAQKK